MDPYKVLEVGVKYSKENLSTKLNQPSLNFVREGKYRCKNSDSYLLFVDLEKSDKKEKRFHFNDFFEGDFFNWDSQTTQHIQSPQIEMIINGELTPHLFVRVNQKIKNKTQPFVYCGRLNYLSYEEGTSYPVHMIFQSEDYDDFTDNNDLIDIYLWKPSVAGKSTSSKISNKGIVSKKRKKNYKKPNITERKGLVTSRVGQGYYRQQIIEKWGGECPITGINVKSILISSHIVAWSESSDEERLDVENGILLSPLFDSLFDRHLISFLDTGQILFSEMLNENNIKRLGLSSDIMIPVSKGMKKYLKIHRSKFEKKNLNV
jgi:hypothetical protein